VDETTLREAATALNRNWIKSATDEELRFLEATGDYPELFEKQKTDDGGVRILLAYDPGGDSTKVSGGWSLGLTKSQGWELDRDATEAVFRRTRLRRRLGLPRRDCGARNPNRDCKCLTAALDALGDEIPETKEPIVKAARKLHVRRKPIRRKPKPPAPVLPPVTVQPEPVERLALPPGPPVPPPQNPEHEARPRLWRPKGPPHPLSREAFEAQRDGRITNWRDAIF
jgi:hypothetical protein